MEIAPDDSSPGCNLSENISCWYVKSDPLRKQQLTLSEQLAACRGVMRYRKDEQQSASLIQTAASMDEMAAVIPKTMRRIIPEWRAYRRIVQPNAPVKAVINGAELQKICVLLPTVPRRRRLFRD